MLTLEIFGLFFLFMTAQGQYRIDTEIKNTEHSLTGNLQYDLSMDMNSYIKGDSSVAKRKVVRRRYSPLIVGLYSAVIPGAGQFYTKSYWQGAAFFGAEVLMWVVYAVYEKKGDKETTSFQNYADQHWSVVDYAAWINSNYSGIIGRTISIDANSSLPAWQRVNWSELNSVETQIGNNLNIVTGFTHQLAPHGDQQYYEMVGKYSQFGSGWDDAPTFQAGGFTTNDVIANNGLGNVSPNFLKYRNMRGDANSFYNIANTVSYVILANHIFSALEAAWNAAYLNHKIKLHGDIQSRLLPGNVAEFVPTLNFQYEL